MGIEKFFNSLKNTYGTNIINKLDDTILLDDEYLLIDFNSIIHNISSSITSSIKYLYHIYIISNRIKTIYIDYKENVLQHLSNLQTDDLFILSSNIILSDYDTDISNEKYNIDINFNKLSIDLIDESLFRLLKINLDKLIIHKVSNYVNKLINKFPKLKMLYMAIDGVPLYAKMIEQRKRRYIGYIVDKAEENLLEYYKKELDKEGDYYNQYNFELYIKSFKFYKTKISPGTNFMIILEKYLLDYLNKFNEKKIEIILDSFNNPGEGEKKIVFKIKDLPKNSKIITYSPDGDVILLMLLEINNYNIKIMRYDQQLHHLDIIDINNLKEIILTYMDNKENYIIKDIVMLFTILGNDFLPKIDIINTNRHITIILDCYKKLNANIFSNIVNWRLLKEFFILLNNILKNEKEKKIFRNKEWKLEKNQLINSNAINYYKQLFYIEYLTNLYNPNNYKNQNIEIINNKKMTSKYLLGYLWLFEYYINNELKYNYYYYNYDDSPTLDNIINYLNTIDNKDLYKRLDKYIIENNKYFIPKLQLKFITPKKIKLNLFIKNNKINIFDYLDCKNAMYLSKCNIKKIKLKSGRKFLKKYINN